MTGPLGSRLRTVGALGDTDLRESRTVTLDGWSGTLVGLIPLGEQTSLVLLTGGSRVFSPFLPNETPVEVWLQPRRAAR